MSAYNHQRFQKIHFIPTITGNSLTVTPRLGLGLWLLIRVINFLTRRLVDWQYNRWISLHGVLQANKWLDVSNIYMCIARLWSYHRWSVGLISRGSRLLRQFHVNIHIIWKEFSKVVSDCLATQSPAISETVLENPCQLTWILSVIYQYNYD